MDESNATCGKRLDSIGLENNEANRLAYRELLVTTPGIGNYISGAILFEETLYQKISTGKTIVEALNAGGMVPGTDPCCSILLVTGFHIHCTDRDCQERCFTKQYGNGLGSMGASPARVVVLF